MYIRIIKAYIVGWRCYFHHNPFHFSPIDAFV